MAKYDNLSTKKGEVKVKQKSDKTIAKEAAKSVDPIYKQQKSDTKATKAANEAANRAAKQGAMDSAAVSRATLSEANKAEAKRQREDTAMRGLRMDNANTQNLTGKANLQSIADLTRDTRQELDAVNRQSALARQEATQALKNMDYARASQLLTEANRLKNRQQELYAKANQYNWQVKQAKKSGGSGGGGGTPQPQYSPWQQLVNTAAQSNPAYQAGTTIINRAASYLNDLVKKGLLTEKQAIEQWKKYDKYGLMK